MRKIATLLLSVALLICAIPVLTVPGLSATGGFQGVVTGTVLNDTGAPMPGVMVTARNDSTNTSVTAVTNISGTFELNITIAGNYNVSAAIVNFNPNTTYINVKIAVGSSVKLNFTMSEILGLLHGFVTDGLAPVNGVTVFLANNNRNYTTTTLSPLGEYRLNGIQPGVYVVTFEKKGYERTNSLPLEIIRGVTKQQNASMQAQPARLSGRVTDNNNPVDGVTVTVISQYKSEVVNTDTTGNFSIQLTSDTYTVTFSKKGYDPKEVSISIAPFEDRKIDVSIVKSKSNNSATFLFGFDLPHSLMVVGLMLALITICVALFINFKVRKKPEMLGKDPDEGKKEG
jgi:hypothetical protein